MFLSNFMMYLLAFLFTAQVVRAHFAAWHIGMYCLNGTSGKDDPNTNDAVNPLFNLTKKDWWFHHVNGCDHFPPNKGDFLELPANGEFTLELALNRAFTSFSYDSELVDLFGDGEDHPGLGVTPPGKEPKCITGINIHTQNQSMAAGTAFAISYESELDKVTPENLVVFTVLYNTPWHRIATYKVPNLPACPPAGCTCAWGWVPNGCGQPNMYMEGFKCKVVGRTGDAMVAPAKPAVWCEDDVSKCVDGPKQMIYWNQLDGNNIDVEGVDLAGDWKSPAYNAKLGFKNGAQTDIFLEPGSATVTSIHPSRTRPLIPVSTSKADGHSRLRGPGVRYLIQAAHRYIMILYGIPFFPYY